MTAVFRERRFSATHQIRIAGELEPVHGHDFRAVLECAVDDDRDASLLEPVLDAALADLARTHLEAVAGSQGGLPSAERVAAHLFHEVSRRLSGDPAARVLAVTVHEAVGCSATYRAS